MGEQVVIKRTIEHDITLEIDSVRCACGADLKCKVFVNKYDDIDIEVEEHVCIQEEPCRME